MRSSDTPSKYQDLTLFLGLYIRARHRDDNDNWTTTLAADNAIQSSRWPTTVPRWYRMREEESLC